MSHKRVALPLETTENNRVVNMFAITVGEFKEEKMYFEYAMFSLVQGVPLQTDRMLPASANFISQMRLWHFILRKYM